eukprot:UN25857
MCASSLAALWRVVLMPLNTAQTMRQVQGVNGFTILHTKLRSHGMIVLFHGGTSEALTFFWSFI